MRKDYMEMTMEQLSALSEIEPADPRLQAVFARDAAFDGRFVYSVRSTGVYCRPSCPSRNARVDNIGFHDTPAEAEAAGFRPCLRCRPNGLSDVERKAGLIAEACRLIDEAETPPSLERLARQAGLSQSFFHRLFKSVTGQTPKAYAAAGRARRVQQGLAEGEGRSVTEAIYDAGFNASSRFYENSGKILGMKPGVYRDGGRDADVTFALAQCSLGAILVAESDRGICAILLGDDPEMLLRDLEDRFPKARLVGGDEQFEARVAQVVAFVEAPRIGLDLPLDIRGTAFQNRVWEALRRIPAGKTVSYSELAQKLGLPKATRAVAGACAANPIAVAVPCHRVVRTDGSLSGYRWGLERKRALLDREAAAS